MLKTAKVVGLNSDLTASLALVSRGEIAAIEREKAENLQPFLFIIIACSVDDAFSRTRQCLADAESAFYTTSAPIPEKLTQTAEAVKQSLSDVEDLQVLLASYQEDYSGCVLYLMCKGDFLGAYLIRGDKYTNLVAKGGEYQLVSGILQEGDRVVMATESLLTLLGGSVEALARMPMENLEDEVEIRLPEAENYPVATIVIEKEKIITGEPMEDLLPQTQTEERYLRFRPNPLFWINSLKYLILKNFPHSKRGLGILGAALLLIIMGATIYSFKHKKDVQNLAKFNSSFQMATEEYNKARVLKDQDPASSAQSLDRAKSFLAEALKIQPQNSRALDFKKQLEENSGGILKNMPVTDFPLWLDLDLVKRGFSAKNLSLSHGKVLLLDTTKRSLVEVDLASKSHDFLGGEEQLGKAELSSLNGDIAWVYSGDKGIVQIDTKNSQSKTMIKMDKEWGTISQIFGFAGNVYLLDSGKNQIWKYLPTASGYSDKREYFKAETKADLVGAKRLQIDSSVWVLKSGGEIIKYTQGAVDYFSIGGLDKGIKDPKSIFVSDDTDNLYILDSGNNRLVVLDKKGIYKAQYTSDRFYSFSDLVADEVGKKVYLLGGSKIFMMELK